MQDFKAELVPGSLLKAVYFDCNLGLSWFMHKTKNFATFAEIEGGQNNAQFLTAYFGIVNGIDAP